MTQYMLTKQIMRQAVNKNLSYEADVLHSSFCYNRSVSLSICIYITYHHGDAMRCDAMRCDAMRCDAMQQIESGLLL